MQTLLDILDACTVSGDLQERLAGGVTRCLACAHRCVIAEGARGVCRMRFNQGGGLRVPFGYVSGAQCDPIEKKPFFHVRPGALAYSFGMPGCNLKCGYCQNWMTSQTLRDDAAFALPTKTSPDVLVAAACAQGAEVIVSTYNEPLITSEWSMAVFREARAAGLLTAYVSNGFASEEVWRYLRPQLDLCKVDLKAFDDASYRRLGGRLPPVLDSLRTLYEMGVWLEVVTLLVPGFNDCDEELKKMASALVGISPDIPWHVTAFHPDYRMTGAKPTTAESLRHAAEIGRAGGLRFVYAGNLPGSLRDWETTRCPDCASALVERCGYRILRCTIGADGRCATCGCSVPGRWRGTKWSAPSAPVS